MRHKREIVEKIKKGENEDMSNDLFQLIHSKHAVGIQSKLFDKGLLKGSEIEEQVVLLAYYCPYANDRRNNQLDKELQKAYKRYCRRVLYDKMGLF